MSHLLFDMTPEGYLNKEEAKEATRRYWELLVASWGDGWNHYYSLPEETRVRLETLAPARPVAINALALSFAKEHFAQALEDGQAEICEDLQFLKIYIGQHVVFRFNALGKDRLVRNIRSSEQKYAYFTNQPISGIRNAATRLTVGYLTDESTTRMESIWITLQHNDQLVYDFRIDDGEALQMPAKSPQPKPQPRTSVQRKGDRQRNSKEG